jgi:hypothetical protein
MLALPKKVNGFLSLASPPTTILVLALKIAKATYGSRRASLCGFFETLCVAYVIKEDLFALPAILGAG